MMKKLLAGGAALLMPLTPALAQTAPPPGVAQGTTPLGPQLMRHSPPVIRTSRAMSGPRGDRVITRDEMLSHVREMFSRIDTNHDGFITRDELRAFDSKMKDAMRTGEQFRGRFRESRFEGRSGSQSFRKEDRAALFDRLDTNHDGVISRQEFMAAKPQVRERRMMVMRDGGGPDASAMASMGDMQKEGPGGMRMRGTGMRGGFAAHLFAMADSNHDGRVSLQEAEAAALAHFDRIDLNHDGKITPDERRQARERMRQDSHPG